MSTPADQNPFAPPAARVDDITVGGQQLAGRGARFGAAIIDGLIQGAVYFAVVFAAVPSLRPGATQGFGQLAVTLALGIVVFLVVQGYLLVTRGQTIGKMLLGLRIVRPDGSRVDPGRVLGLRYVANWVLMSIPFIGWIYSLVDSLMIFRESRKCLHDNIADTIVVTA